jgi:[acyl-carrier-protein] S-malonyltransferase
LPIALFPGQGVQTAGMDGGLVHAQPDVFATASDVLGVDVVQLCADGRSGSADLTSTRWAQPAVLVCSVASFRALESHGETVDQMFRAAAGHSVGEYAALVAAGVLDLADALRLLVIRGEAMDEAAKRSPGGMAAVMRIDRAEVERICSETGVGLAADNGPGQLVISGALGPLDRAIEGAECSGGKCRRLDIAGAFHSPAMAPAKERLAEAFRDVNFAAPRFDVWSTTTAVPLTTDDAFRSSLAEQLVAPVRWHETVLDVAKRHGTSFIDVGPGRVVGALTRRIVEGAEIAYASEILELAAKGSA